MAFPVAFLVTDAIEEFHGYKQARKAVISGVIASLLLAIISYAVLSWQPAPWWQAQGAFETVLSQTPRIVLASTITLLISNMTDITIFDKIKKQTDGKMLWLRNCGSTITAQLVDSAIFVLLAFYGVLPTSALISIFIGQFAVKSIIAGIDTPFLYYITWTTEKLGLRG